jgi:hypothetical protein
LRISLSMASIPAILAVLRCRHLPFRGHERY